MSLSPVFIGHMVKAARLARGWDVVDLSRETAIVPYRINDIEEGHRSPTRTQAERLNRALDISIPLPDAEVPKPKAVIESNEKTDAILTEIKRYVKKNYCTPTLRELMQLANISSTSMVTYHIEKLIATKALVELKAYKKTRNRYQLPEVVEAIQKL